MNLKLKPDDFKSMGAMHTFPKIMRLILAFYRVAIVFNIGDIIIEEDEESRPSEIKELEPENEVWDLITY